MTIEEYIKNPTGKGSAAFSNKLLYQKMYMDKWDTLLVRENGKIAFKLFKSDDDYYVYIQIPSEVVPKFYYDTVIRFYLTKETKKLSMETTLKNYQVQFFSNDPSFVYTFAHAFKSNDMFIADLEFKMSKQALKEKAVIRNPKDEIGYVKSLYFAYIQIKHSNLLAKNRWVTADKYNASIWKSLVTHADEKVQKRQELGAEIERKEKSKNSNRISPNKVNKIKKMISPNIPKFGHFKKTNFNKIPKFVSTKKFK